jgi:hypothetical protein
MGHLRGNRQVTAASTPQPWPEISGNARKYSHSKLLATRSLAPKRCQAPKISPSPMLASPPHRSQNIRHSISLPYTSKMLASRFPNPEKVPGTLYFASPPQKPHIRATKPGLGPQNLRAWHLVLGARHHIWRSNSTRTISYTDSTVVSFGGNQSGFASDRDEKSGRESKIPCRFCLLFRPPS